MDFTIEQFMKGDHHRRSDRSSYWYLASPYSIHKDGLDAAFKDAANAAALILESGLNVFSPIVHSHSLVTAGLMIDPRNHSYWMKIDEPFMVAACGMIVLIHDGWQDSRGIKEEMAYFTEAKKPIAFMTPNELPILPKMGAVSLASKDRPVYNRL